MKKMEIERKMKSTIFYSNIIPFQDLFSRETDFHFHQFLSNFFKYFSSNLLSFYLYNIFTIYFSSNFSLLKSCSSTTFFVFLLLYLISLQALLLLFTFSKSSFLSHILFSAVNLY